MTFKETWFWRDVTQNYPLHNTLTLYLHNRWLWKRSDFVEISTQNYPRDHLRKTTFWTRTEVREVSIFSSQRSPRGREHIVGQTWIFRTCNKLNPVLLSHQYFFIVKLNFRTKEATYGALDALLKHVNLFAFHGPKVAGDVINSLVTTLFTFECYYYYT